MKEQIKIAYFPSNAPKVQVLTYNGKTLDNYCVSCSTEEDFSNYTLDARFIIKDNIQDLLAEENILKVQLDYGKEIFRISKVTIGTKYIDIEFYFISSIQLDNNKICIWTKNFKRSFSQCCNVCNYDIVRDGGYSDIFRNQSKSLGSI